MSWAVLVVGVAGVGKTRFGRLLSKALRINFIDLPEFVAERGLHSGYDEESQAYLIDLRGVSAAVGSEVRRRGPAVVASVYAFKPRRVRVRWVLVLRMRPDRLAEVLRARGYPEEKVAVNVEAELLGQPLHEALTRFGKRRVAQLDATEGRFEEMAQEAAQAIRDGEVRRIHREVDWASELERMGKLEEVLLLLARYV